jgi:hypothetical protein
MANKKKLFFDFLVLLIIIYSLFLGYNHSKYNQDFHHWSYILSSYIDYKNEFRLFKDIFLQYGPGQLIFFLLVDFFYNINIFSIGLIINFVYSINLILIYKILSNITSRLISFLLFFIIFLIHPFATVPWPDYLSGFCLSLFFYFFLKKKNKTNDALCAIFIFLAIFFRSTYLLNIFLSLIFFNFFSYFFYKKFFYIRLILYFFMLLLIYFSLLIYHNNFIFYFYQSFNLNHFVFSRYNLSGISSNYYDILISYFKIFLIWIISFSNFLKIKNIFFLIFFFLNLWSFFFLKKSQKELKFLFISLLGITGFVQSFLNYDIFRNINSSIGIFITGCFLFEKYKMYTFLKKKITYFKLFNILFIVFIFILIVNFPNNSTLFRYENYNNKNYNTLNINFFSNNKKIPLKLIEYYEYLEKFLCEKDYKITNFTGDFSISYLCNNKNSKLISPMQGFALLNNNYSEYERIFLKKELYKNELFLSPKEINDPKLILLIKKDSPHVPKFWYGDIYVYKSSRF